MSSLSGQSIQSTYQGLLKLSNSTTGITTSLQAIEDGLGNNTGLRITTDQLDGPNLVTAIRLKGRFYGNGFSSTSAAQMAAGTQNIILAQPFYDSGLYSYSAISYNLTNVTTSSDTVEAAIYTSQLINPNGLYPSSPIISGITIETTGSTGVRTTTTTTFSMSGYGAGIYWLVFKYTNSGVQPTARYGTNQGPQFLTTSNILTNAIYGVTTTFTANQYIGFYKQNNTAAGYQAFSGKTTFDNPFPTNMNTLQSTSPGLAGSGLGFVLHTVDAS